MIDEREKYERPGQALREENASTLEEFSSWLRAKGLSDTTVKRHRGSIDFYINEFLLSEDATPPAKGVDEVGMFLGYWFIQKAMWASQSSMKSYAASLKKFYQFMVERGSVDQKALDELNARVKEDMPEWLETLRRYDDPSIKDPFDIGIL